jgi:hypothetical protein
VAEYLNVALLSNVAALAVCAGKWGDTIRADDLPMQMFNHYRWQADSDLAAG